MTRISFRNGQAPGLSMYIEVSSLPATGGLVLRIAPDDALLASATEIVIDGERALELKDAIDEALEELA